MRHHREPKKALGSSTGSCRAAARRAAFFTCFSYAATTCGSGHLDAQGEQQTKSGILSRRILFHPPQVFYLVCERLVNGFFSAVSTFFTAACPNSNRVSFFLLDIRGVEHYTPRERENAGRKCPYREFGGLMAQREYTRRRFKLMSIAERERKRERRESFHLFNLLWPR